MPYPGELLAYVVVSMLLGYALVWTPYNIYVAVKALRPTKQEQE